MPLNGHGRFTLPKRGKTGILYISAALVRDSAFPLQEGVVKIRVEGDCLIIKNEDARAQLKNEAG